MTAAVGSSVVGHVCLQVMVLHSGILLMFDRVLGSDDNHALMPSRFFPVRSDQRIAFGPRPTAER
jgi:hypothetical protein